MSDRPVKYDLYCGQGGCTKGYQDAGFYVIGVDIDPQPRYIGDEFIQVDALEFLRRYLAGEYREAFSFHASPPCQGYSRTQKLQANEHPDLIEQTRDLLMATGKPFVIENVVGAPLINPVLLTGGMFGLLTNRPRLFECHGFEVPFVLQPPPAGQAKMGRPPRWDGDFIQPVGHFPAVEYARRAMGIDWMNQYGLSQAIPPAYTEFIGRHLMKAIKEAAYV